ncbi:TonB C-terminal domain-containing protein [Algibacter sp. Ld11]|uniref:TonB C-terminal domain-containing protein n=1 Tax=Algibacter sp. Ld11 TaxID=649150 RepID=UPI003870D0DF
MKTLFTAFLFLCCFNAISQEDKPREVSFAIKEEKAIFPGCEKMGTSYKREECTNRKIYEFIGKHIDPEIAVKLGLKGKHRVKVAITIDRKGEISKLESNSDNKKITKAIKKTFKKFPTMIPYKTRGMPSSTRLILPITFMGIS